MGKERTKEKVNRAKAIDTKKAKAEAKEERAKAAEKAAKATHSMVAVAAPHPAKPAITVAPQTTSSPIAPYNNSTTKTSPMLKQHPSMKIINKAFRSQRKLILVTLSFTCNVAGVHPSTASSKTFAPACPTRIPTITNA